jgi:pimeloyl-ACP methyl ester carboxylesterase
MNMGRVRFKTVQITVASLIAGLFAFTSESWSQTVLNSIQDLQNINNNLAGNYVLGGDIDASGLNFTPVGCYGVCPNGYTFTGTLDGKGHTVNNLTIVTSSSYGGLFLGVSGVVKNIGLTKASVASKGFSVIGGIAGTNTGSISNSYVTGSINGVNAAAGGLVGVNDYTGSITQSYANVLVSGTGTGGGQDGGIVGDNYGTVSQSYATGAVTGSSPGIGSMVGGLVGYNAGAIRQSYSLASVTGANFNPVGGLVGENANTISESYAAGRVQGAAGNSVGGLVGFAFLPNAVVDNSYWDTQATGWATSAGGTGLVTAQLQSGTPPTGFDPTVWVAILGQYPQFQWKVPTHPAFPVVFVHGFCSDERTWDTIKPTLRSLGWKFGGTLNSTGDNLQAQAALNQTINADYYTVTFPDPAINNSNGLDGWGADLQLFLRKIRMFRGSPSSTKFIIVAHSDGGLAARAYLQSHNSTRTGANIQLRYNNDIYHLITYGTPHDGTPLAQNIVLDDLFQVISDFQQNACGGFITNVNQLAASQGVKDMLPKSAFLNEINNGKFPTGGVLYTSLIATADDLFFARPLCNLFDLRGGWGTDCIVKSDSQNLSVTLKQYRPTNPPSVATRIVTNYTHSTLNVPTPLGAITVTPGGTEDVTGILWAIRRSVPGF